MRGTRFLLAALVCVAPPLGAQPVSFFGPELRPFVGVFVPTSDQRDDFKNALMLGGQAAFELDENFHVVSSLSWTAGHNRFGIGTTDNTYIWQYDIGGEMNLVGELANDWLVRPFVGIGGGGRTYQYRATGMPTKTCTAGYGALGTELQSGAFAWRVEARDYLNCYQSPFTGKRRTRNDAMFALGFAYHIR